MELILLTIIFGCVILLCLGIIAVMLCVVKMQRKEIDDYYTPIKPPEMKKYTWEDSDFE